MHFQIPWQRAVFRTWPVAAAALLGLLVLIGTSILTASRKAEEIYSQIDQLNSHHRNVETKLRRLRGDVQLSSIYIRDYLLDTDREHAPAYRQQLTDLRHNQSNTLEQLRALLPPAAKPQIDTLESRLDEYWQVFEPLFDWTVVEKIMHSASFLRREVLPRRESVLAITADIERLNDTNLAAQRAEVSRREAEFREDLHRQLWHSLLLGFIVALVAVVRLRTLEWRSDDQRRRAEEAEREMRQLSQQLVAAQEEERKKLTRELHDHVGQMLTALRMEIGRAGRARGAAGEQASQALAEAKRLLDTILRSVRDLVMGLRPSMLDDFGLQPALEWHVRDFRRHFNIRIELTLGGDLNTLPDQYRTCVYRIVQEALTNCARHSRATRVDISLLRQNGTLELIVSDDGVGIDPHRPRGMGLLGIEERVRELHGFFAISSVQPSGTKLQVKLPLKSARLQMEDSQLARAAG